MKLKVLSLAILVSAMACKSEGNKNTSSTTTTMQKTSNVDMTVASTKALNTTTSTLKWEGHKLTEKHYGEIDFKSGNLQFNAANELVGGSFDVDMNTIDVQDMEAGEWRTKLINHLKDEDFFNVAKFPTAKLVIKSVSKADNKLVYTADLTILETTKPIQFTAESKEGGLLSILEFTINRTDWNIKYNSKSFFADLADKFIIKDEIVFSATLFPQI